MPDRLNPHVLYRLTRAAGSQPIAIGHNIRRVFDLVRRLRREPS